MRIAIFAAVASACLLGSGVAFAADPAPQQTASDIAAALAASAPTQPAAAPLSATASDHACPPGTVWADDGDGGGCDPVKDGTAGFNLGAAHHTGASAASASAATGAKESAKHTTHIASLGRAMPTTPGAHKDLLITFVTGSAVLTPQARSNAHEFAVALADPRLKGKRFEIAGYTDASGLAATNLTLSQRRAEAVKDFLVSQGGDAALLDARGYGSQDLAAPNDPKAAANRRVEARLLN
ncbi:MAG TPA: OmpA family protein [Caulobacteraceae bacterium]|nr:OmpA family protein [Caulobacteraceae bacterium]